VFGSDHHSAEPKIIAFKVDRARVLHNFSTNMPSLSVAEALLQLSHLQGQRVWSDDYFREATGYKWDTMPPPRLELDKVVLREKEKYEAVVDFLKSLENVPKRMPSVPPMRLTESC
jgi:hypothetical protein